MIIGPLFAGATSEALNLTSTFVGGGIIGLMGDTGFALFLRRPVVETG